MATKDVWKGLCVVGFAEAGLKKFLLDDAEKFAAACTEKLATYMMRRAPNFGDRNELQAIVDAGKKEDYRLQSLIEELVCSGLFLKR
jgi:hypothetical protein